MSVLPVATVELAAASPSHAICVPDMLAHQIEKPLQSILLAQRPSGILVGSYHTGKTTLGLRGRKPF